MLGLFTDQDAVRKGVTLVLTLSTFGVGALVVSTLVSPPVVCEGIPSECRRLSIDEVVLGWLPWVGFALAALPAWAIADHWRLDRERRSGSAP